MHIGVFGSTFDPPHKWHIAIAEQAKKELGFDRIILIPTGIPPHKDQPQVAAKLRLWMARLAVGKRKNWTVSDIELRRPGKSYTGDTIRELKKRYPHHKLFWIIGSDSLIFMPQQWREGWKILDRCQFVVVPRKEFSLSRVPKKILKKVIILQSVIPHDISSTEIRARFREGEKATHLLPSPVLHFIKRKKLYEI